MIKSPKTAGLPAYYVPLERGVAGYGQGFRRKVDRSLSAPEDHTLLRQAGVVANYAFFL
jgi:hypothetical protein